MNRLLILLLLSCPVWGHQACGQAGQPVTYVVDAFNPAGTGTNSYSGGQIGNVWSNWFGTAFQSLSWDSTNDADGNAGSGSMKIAANFNGSPNIQFTVWNGLNAISPSISAVQFTAFECDVKFAPGSATVLKNGVPTFGPLQFGMGTPTWGQDYWGSGLYIPATNTGWVHVTIPLNPATDANLYKITNVFVHLYSTALSGSSTLWVDNLKFTGTTVSGTATVNYNNTRQRIDGFGASSAWNSTWSIAEADLFFSTNTGGIGLSVLRSRITPEGTTWETNIMQMAQARGARVWSAPWTPPASYKDSNSVNGGNWIASGSNYQNYANQLANYVASMRTTYGINLEALSLQNEPNASTDYESCVWTGKQLHDFMPYVADALATRGVESTKIMLPESMHWEFSLAVPTMDDPATAQHAGILGGHNYGSRAAPITHFGTPCPLPLWETEHYLDTDDPATNGLGLAEEIHEFMTVAEANAYHYWWLKGSGSGSLAGNSTVTPAKRLYVMGNYSKFVRPGFNRVGVTNNTTALVSAFKDPANSNFVIVAANPTAWPVTQTFNLSSCPSVTTLNQWVTSGTLSLASQAPVSVTGGTFNYVLPAYTVVTLASAPAPAPLIVLKSSDALGSSSFNAKGNWNDTVAPTGGSDYTASQYVLRTPGSGGNYTFAGRSLTLPLLGQLFFKGTNNSTITVGNLILDGGSVGNGLGSTAFTLAGNIAVTADSIITPANDATRTINISASLSGTGALTNGNGGPGTVSYSGSNSAFTGAMIVNGGTVLKVGAKSNLGGNHASFKAGQLMLDNGVFQPTASFTMDNSNSGVTLGTGGGTFLINSGVSLVIANPITGTGNLVKSGSGTLTLSGSNSYTGTTTVNAGTLELHGSITSGTTSVKSGGSLAGNSTTGAVTVNSGGALVPGVNGIGTMTTGALTLAAGSTVAFQLGTASDRINVLGDLALGGTLALLDTGSATTGTFTLFTCTGTRSGTPSLAVPAGFVAALDVSTPGFVKVALTASAYSTWQRGFFTAAEIANPAISGVNVIVAGDGLKNLMKYALGLPPKTPATTGVSLAKSGTNWVFNYRRAASRSDITYSVETRPDLTSGSWSTAGVTHVRITTGDPETWQASYPAGAEVGRFFRLKITQP